MMKAMSLPGFFDALSEEHRETVAKLLTEVEFEPGTTIFTEGDEGDAAYFIDEGDVRIELELPEVDTESVLRYEGPGATLGEVALLDRLPRSATAVADTQVRARTITTASLDELAQRDPAAALGVTQELARDATAKLRRLTEQASDLMFAAAPDPVVDDLVGRAVAAQAQFADWPEDKVDALLGRLMTMFVEHAAGTGRRDGGGDPRRQRRRQDAQEHGRCPGRLRLAGRTGRRRRPRHRRADPGHRDRRRPWA